MLNLTLIARDMFAEFARNAAAIAEAAERASKGMETTEDKALLENAWEESGRGSNGGCRGLLVECDMPSPAGIGRCAPMSAYFEGDNAEG